MADSLRPIQRELGKRNKNVVMKRSNFTAGLCLYLFVGLFAFNSYADEVTIEWKDGTYTGEVSKGVPNGYGTFTDSEGRKFVGQWKDGQPVISGSSNSNAQQSQD